MSTAPKILVKSKPERFRRAGITFSRDGVVLDPAELSKEQLDAIEAEPLLAVSEHVEVAPEPPTKGGAKGAKK